MNIQHKNPIVVHQDRKVHSHVLVALVVTGLTLSSYAATVVGDLHDGVIGDSLNATLVFRPQLTPMGVGNATYLDVTKKTNVVGGAWSMYLVGGIYTVQSYPYGRQIAIVVPINDTNTYQFNLVSDIVLMIGNANTINISNINSIDIYTTNIYSVYITNSDFIVSSNIVVDTLVVKTNYITDRLVLIERQWPGPTNKLDFSQNRWFYPTYTSCSVTGFSGYLTGIAENASLLTISNASSTNIDITLPAGARISVGSTNYVTLTNSDLFIFSFQLVNGRTNIVPRAFH